MAIRISGVDELFCSEKTKRTSSDLTNGLIAHSFSSSLSTIWILLHNVQGFVFLLGSILSPMAGGNAYSGWFVLMWATSNLITVFKV
jgi:hypothetical protein